MPVFKSKELIADLERQVQQLIEQVGKLTALDEQTLNLPAAPGKWSAAQHVAHLNSYNRYYLPEIAKALQRGRDRRLAASPVFRTGFFGNYFTKMMEPPVKGGKWKKYKAPADHVPPPVLNGQEVLREFLEGSERLRDFLQQASRTNMNRLKLPISISRFIRLRLGDVLRFLIAHQRRHFVHIEQTGVSGIKEA